MTTSQGTLFVCAVPIGNLADATPRLREVLGRVDVIACEDTRTTRRLLDLIDVTTDARMLAHHEHNERAGAAGIVPLLESGNDVALVSDAGTPAVSDPGVALVDAAHAAGIEVVAVPGASSVAAAVSIAGFEGSGFHFVGFLPRKAGELTALLHATAGELVVALESPNRVRASLDIVAGVHPERRVAVCRELTKRHEEVVRGAAAVVREQLGDTVKGEIVVVLEPLGSAADRARSGVSEADVQLVQAMVEEGVRAKRACSIVADAHGVASRELYDAVTARRSSQD